MMPDKQTWKRAADDKAEGKSPSTQAGEFVREEIEHIREGKHGARSTKQAIAIGLSKARRAGVKLAVPKKGTVSEKVRKRASRDNAIARERPPHVVSRARSRASTRMLKRDGKSAVSKSALSEHAKEVARRPRKAAKRARSTA